MTSSLCAGKLLPLNLVFLPSQSGYWGVGDLGASINVAQLLIKLEQSLLVGSMYNEWKSK